MWDRTTSHQFFMLSADGTHAVFAPRFFDLGVLTLALDDSGHVDQDKSVFKPYGAGCFPGMCPDNSYRWFRLEGSHRVITMFDADGAKPRQINVSNMPGVNGHECWLTRWSTDPRFFTLMGPEKGNSQIYVGRFDDKFTKVEGWVQVTSDDGTKNFLSHSWVEPAPAANP